MANITILLIEQNTNLDSILRDTLLEHDYNLIGCSDIEYLDSLLKTTSIDVVIADAEMYSFDSFNIKALLNNDNNRIPIIYLSTQTSRNTLQQTEVGAVSFISMPFTQEQLLQAINKAIAYKQLIREHPEYLAPIARLYIEQKGYTPIELLMSRSYTIGRYRNSDVVKIDIRLMSPSVSRKHGIFCRVYDSDQSYYKIVDYSQNGIKVNGKKIKGYQQLKHGDRISIADCEMLYEVIERSESTDLLDITYTSEEDAK